MTFDAPSGIFILHFMRGGIALNKLEEIRKQKHFSVTKLAELSGITRQTITRLESEKLDCANSKTLKALADALGVSIAAFFSE